jgi:hypothetical protein
MSNLAISNSFVQNQTHATKSERFIPIQPLDIAQRLENYGFHLVDLKSGLARNPDRADFQNTIARYRHADAFKIQSGGRELYMDLVFKVPHLYGAIQCFVGTFRQVCSNGLTVGTKFVTGRVGHTGNALNQLELLIPTMVSQHDQLVDTIREMQARNVTPSELAQLASGVASIRLADTENVTKVFAQDLLHVRRGEDRQSDLFTVINVIQENVIRHGLRYQTTNTNEQGIVNIRNNNARPVKESSLKSIDLNASIWDEATKLLAA